MPKDIRIRERRYAAVNLPIRMCKELDEIVKKEGIYGSRAKLVIKIIQDFIIRWRKDELLKKQLKIKRT